MTFSLGWATSLRLFLVLDFVVSTVEIPNSQACGREWEEFLRATQGYSFSGPGPGGPGPGGPTVGGNLQILGIFPHVSLSGLLMFLLCSEMVQQ